jgi:hypothetical protein
MTAELYDFPPDRQEKNTPTKKLFRGSRSRILIPWSPSTIALPRSFGFWYPKT